MIRYFPDDKEISWHSRLMSGEKKESMSGTSFKAELK